MAGLIGKELAAGLVYIKELSRRPSILSHQLPMLVGNCLIESLDRKIIKVFTDEKAYIRCRAYDRLLLFITMSINLLDYLKRDKKGGSYYFSTYRLTANASFRYITDVIKKLLFGDLVKIF